MKVILFTLLSSIFLMANPISDINDKFNSKYKKDLYKKGISNIKIERDMFDYEEWYNLKFFTRRGFVDYNELRLSKNDFILSDANCLLNITYNKRDKVYDLNITDKCKGSKTPREYESFLWSIMETRIEPLLIYISNQNRITNMKEWE